jgi:LemA protein
VFIRKNEQLSIIITVNYPLVKSFNQQTDKCIIKGDLMLVPAIIGGVAVLGIIFIYNSLIGRKNEVENALGGLDAHLKQRYDLIPNLVAATKKYMEHESGVLEKIVELRNIAAQKNLSQKKKQDINTDISNALTGLMVQVEQYPELKASANFVELQKSLKEVEENIAASRRFYNAAVTEYNNGIQMFPHTLIATLLQFKKKEVFNIPEAEKKNVNIQNLFDGKAS